MCTALIAGRELPGAVISRIFEQTEGNPFFVSEVVRLLVAEGGLDRQAGEVSGRARTPEGVREVINRRLDRLSPACNHVLTLAAVIGREFALPALQLASGYGIGRLLLLIEEAEVARVVAEVPAVMGRYRFAHALIRDTLYEQLTAALRTRLHHAVGEALEKLHSEDVGPHLAEIASHFLSAAPLTDADKALGYAVNTAKQAMSMLAYEEAA